MSFFKECSKVSEYFTLDALREIPGQLGKNVMRYTRAFYIYIISSSSITGSFTLEIANTTHRVYIETLILYYDTYNLD